MKTLLIEYDTGISLDHLVSYGLKMSELIKSAELANNRISHNLKINRGVLSIKNGCVRAIGVAGIIRLNQNMELEIMPKFYSPKNRTEWRATLYLLSALSKHGNIMINEKIKSNTSHINSLYDMAGRILAEEYIKNRRKPIREYHKNSFEDFCIDGEIDFESFLEQNPNGYKQTQIRFDKLNIYNATIKLAMQTVLPFIFDIRTKNILKTAIEELGNQKYKNIGKQKIPVRNREWENIYNLAFDIVQGLGTSFTTGSFFSPGFIANTWQIWEWLITTSVMIGTENKKVVSQHGKKFGKKIYGKKEYSVNVYPDVIVYTKDNPNIPEYLVDAKYKLLVNEKTGEIDRNDLYEAYAFCETLDVDNIFLAYPTQTSEKIPSGSVIRESLYRILGVNVIIVKVAFGPLNERNGIYSFSKNFVKGIESILTR